MSKVDRPRRTSDWRTCARSSRPRPARRRNPSSTRPLAALTEFGKVDARIREYLKADSRLMAADVVFTEGGEAADGARRHIEEARSRSI